jgi:rRNA maturation RNase YbeY
MTISFFNEDVKEPIQEKVKIKKWLKTVAGKYDKVIGEISFIFCSDEYLLNINKEYLDHNYYTDVITFDYCEADKISGDIFISLERVEENAENLGTVDSELYRVMIHGVLHLIGFKDHSDISRRIMRREENSALKILEKI